VATNIVSKRPTNRNRHLGVHRLERPEDARVLRELVGQEVAIDDEAVETVDDPGRSGRSSEAWVIHLILLGLSAMPPGV
jgi:hypothetical protein